MGEVNMIPWPKFFIGTSAQNTWLVIGTPQFPHVVDTDLLPTIIFSGNTQITWLGIGAPHFPHSVDGLPSPKSHKIVLAYFWGAIITPWALLGDASRRCTHGCNGSCIKEWLKRTHTLLTNLSVRNIWGLQYIGAGLQYIGAPKFYFKYSEKEWREKVMIKPDFVCHVRVYQMD